jgi:hypothetical protein
VLLILKSPFTTSIEERERCYSFVLSRTPHETVPDTTRNTTGKYSWWIIYVRNCSLPVRGLKFLFDQIRCEFHYSFSFTSGLDELHAAFPLGNICRATCCVTCWNLWLNNAVYLRIFEYVCCVLTVHVERYMLRFKCCLVRMRLAYKAGMVCG